MKPILDRSLTITINLRQVRRWLLWLLFAGVPIYMVAMLWHGRSLELSGSSPRTSPFRAMIPEECMGFADRNSGLGMGHRQWKYWPDSMLLGGRIHHIPIDQTTLVLPNEKQVACYGAAIVASLYGGGFTDIYEDEAGNPLLTVSVTPHGPYAVHKWVTPQEVSK